MFASVAGKITVFFLSWGSGIISFWKALETATKHVGKFHSRGTLNSNMQTFVPQGHCKSIVPNQWLEHTRVEKLNILMCLVVKDGASLGRVDEYKQLNWTNWYGVWRSNQKHWLSNFANIVCISEESIIICQFIIFSTFCTYEMAKCCLAEVPQELILPGIYN